MTFWDGLIITVFILFFPMLMALGYVNIKRHNWFEGMFFLSPLFSTCGIIPLALALWLAPPHLASKGCIISALSVIVLQVVVFSAYCYLTGERTKNKVAG